MSNKPKINRDPETGRFRNTLTIEQKEILLEWIAAGDSTEQIVFNASQFHQPFETTSGQINYYRGKHDIDISRIRRERELEAIFTGLALRSNRLKKLYQLANLLEDDIFLKDKMWLQRVKGVGTGNTFERVIEWDFNEAELRQLRGVYDDIAKEVGGRRYETIFGDAEDITTSPLISLPADMIASPFIDIYRDIKQSNHTEYIFKGGRGSTKSSFTSLVFIYLLIRNPDVHGLALRQVANTLRDSVYTQLVWAINILGLDDFFKCITNPLEITYKPTGQKIYFRGADKPEKIKSIKTVFGHIGILWFEELDQFHGQESIRKIEQSVFRGGEQAWEFKTYNPPRTSGSWVNNYVLEPKKNQLQHHSTYLEVPKEWLGSTFIAEAEHLKEINPRAYEHEYLGSITGTGGLVFDNLEIRHIGDEEIYGTEDEYGGQLGGFETFLYGLDFGYFPDPAHWIKVHYNPSQLTLYIVDEYRGFRNSNRDLYTAMQGKGMTEEEMVIADSAEPKSIADLRTYGMKIRGAEKGADSVKYSIKWLQSLRNIVIDPERCPHAAIEFQNYEHEMTKEGEYISEYPDKDNHAIDAVRYATNLVWRRRGR